MCAGGVVLVLVGIGFTFVVSFLEHNDLTYKYNRANTEYWTTQNITKNLNFKKLEDIKSNFEKFTSSLAYGDSLKTVSFYYDLKRRGSESKDDVVLEGFEGGKANKWVQVKKKTFEVTGTCVDETDLSPLEDVYAGKYGRPVRIKTEFDIRYDQSILDEVEFRKKDMLENLPSDERVDFHKFYRFSGENIRGYFDYEKNYQVNGEEEAKGYYYKRSQKRQYYRDVSGMCYAKDGTLPRICCIIPMTKYTAGCLSVCFCMIPRLIFEIYSWFHFKNITITIRKVIAARGYEPRKVHKAKGSNDIEDIERQNMNSDFPDSSMV